METMRMRIAGKWRRLALVGVLGLVAMSAGRIFAEPSVAATARYDTYIGGVEKRLARQHASSAGFVEAGAEQAARLRHGDLVVERMSPNGDDALPGAMLHHWRARAFVTGVHEADVERALRDVASYTRVYAPQVLRAKGTPMQGGGMRTAMRVRQKHVLVAVLDTDYDVVFGRLDAGHGWSWSRSTRVAEISEAGTERERALGPGEDHGFLWRQNTYWSWAEADGGVYLEIESVSLTRSIPTGLGWAIRPFVESVPRESLEFTLRATASELRKGRQTR